LNLTERQIKILKRQEKGPLSNITGSRSSTREFSGRASPDINAERNILKNREHYRLMLSSSSIWRCRAVHRGGEYRSIAD